MIENEPEVLSAFLRASAKGFADVKNDPEGGLQTLLDNQNEENFPCPRRWSRRAWRLCFP